MHGFGFSRGLFISVSLVELSSFRYNGEAVTKKVLNVKIITQKKVKRSQ